MKTIYTVTTMHFREPDYGPTPRCVAWFPSLDEARACILENRGDIWETVYTYALIEELEPGLYPDMAAEHWFIWNHEEHAYEATTARPAEAEQWAHFSIG